MPADITGITRNLTEVFTLLRSNAQQNKFVYFKDTDAVAFRKGDEEKMSLIELENDKERSSSQPFWIHTADEVEFEFERIRSRIDELSTKQRKQVSRPNFGEEFETENMEMGATTEQITQMLTHCQRLIKMMTTQTSRNESSTESRLRENAANSLNFTLSQLTNDFKTKQVKFLRGIENRTSTVDSFLVTNTTVFDEPNWEDLGDASTSSEMTMTQLQQFITNDKEVREREKKVIAVNSSIRELNTLFKDISNMIVDQGTILDRIDYNVEQTSIKVDNAVGNISKAERQQRADKKMHCICILTVCIIFVLILIISTKL